MDGQQEMEKAVAAVTARAERVDPEWLDAAYDEVLRLAGKQVKFTSETVWNAVGKPANADPRALGGVFRSASVKGIIAPTGEVLRADSRTRRKGLLRVWRGVAHFRSGL